MPIDHFGAHVAARYDEDEDEDSAARINRTVDFLVEHAQGGPALEFAIGTGRIAPPLSRRGVPVTGIDLSEAMLAQLRAKPGSAAIPITVRDMADTVVPGAFALVYLVFNTIGNLTTQDEQVACFANAAAHLGPGGRFAIEVGVPDLQRLPPGETVRPFTVASDRLGFDVYDVVQQGLTSYHYRFDRGRAELMHVPFRYVWPAELDLMARLAGMTLIERWSSWERAEFTAQSRSHVSVWRKD